MYAWNPTQEAKARGLQVQGQPPLYSEPEGGGEGGRGTETERGGQKQKQTEYSSLKTCTDLAHGVL